VTFSHLYSSALDQELGNDDSTRLFTTARRKRAINAAHLQFADLTECAIRWSTFSCSNGVGEYDLVGSPNITGGDYIRIAKPGIEYRLVSSGGASSNSTRFVAGDLLPRREIQWLNQYEYGWRSSTGADPMAYYERMDGGRRFLGLWPPPRIQSSEVGSVLIAYVAKPSTLTADTSIPFTFGANVREDLEPYHQALVHYAASELEKLRLNNEASQIQLQQFSGYLQRYAQAMQPKDLKTVRLARSYFGEARSRRSETEREIMYPWRIV